MGEGWQTAFAERLEPAEKVVEEPQTLYRYMLGQRNQMGIRLVRLACCVN